MASITSGFKLILFLLLTSVGILFVVLCINAFIVVPMHRDPWDYQPEPKDPQNQQWTLDSRRRLERAQKLAKALSIPTISFEDGSQDGETFLLLHQHIRKSFPLVHSSNFITLSVVNKYSLLYRIQGTIPDTDQPKPYLLTGHMDVVPVNNGSWSANPFGGRILDGEVIYGRGAIDDKHSVMGILEALEFLLERNYRPKRSFFIGFGHDEEISGVEGAKRIAEELQARGITELDFVLDEGLFILDGFLDGIDRPVAVIGVSEKGYATLEMSVEGTSGHSSIPPKTTSIGTLGRALGRLEENPQPNLFGKGPEMDFFASMAPFANGIHRLIFSNLWITSPLLKLILAGKEETDALQRTTTAITVFNAGLKSNVVPGRASALVNHRIHPAQTLDQVIEHDRSSMKDPRVRISVQSSYPPMKVSPYGPSISQYSLIARSVKQVFPDSIIAPACSPAYTDLQQYKNLSSKLYRLTPNVVTPLTQKGLHGDNEQISVSEYHDLIRVYVRLILNADVLPTRNYGEGDGQKVTHPSDL